MHKLFLVYCYSENRASSQIWKVLSSKYGFYPRYFFLAGGGGGGGHANYPGLSFLPRGFSPYRGGGGGERKDSSGTGLM